MVKFSKNFNFGQIFENFDFGQISKKVKNLVKISIKFRFWSKFSKIFDLSQIFRKNLDFGKIFEKLDFFENFEKF